MPLNKVELHPAHQWDYESCGKENFCRGIVMELTDEDAVEMVAQEGGEKEDWQTGKWLTAPDEVTCANCGVTFATEDQE